MVYTTRIQPFHAQMIAAATTTTTTAAGAVAAISRAVTKRRTAARSVSESVDDSVASEGDENARQDQAEAEAGSVYERRDREGLGASDDLIEP